MKRYLVWDASNLDNASYIVAKTMDEAVNIFSESIHPDPVFWVKEDGNPIAWRYVSMCFSDYSREVRDDELPELAGSAKAPDIARIPPWTDPNPSLSNPNRAISANNLDVLADIHRRVTALLDTVQRALDTVRTIR